MKTRNRTSKTSRRELIEPRAGDKRYVRRNRTGQFKKEVDVGRSLATDRRRDAQTLVPRDRATVAILVEAGYFFPELSER